MHELLTTCKRVVVKIGSSLVASSNGGLQLDRIERLTKEFGDLQSGDRELVIVSSGAIVAGISHLGLTTYPQELPLRQAAAAVGQSHILWAYETAFKRSGHKIAQILLTHQDLGEDADDF